MNTLLNLARTAFLALLFAGVVSACDSNSALEDGATDEQEMELLAASLSSDLSLSASQQSALTNTMNRIGDQGVRDPGFLWRLAAELATTLTDEQKQRLLDRAAQGPGGGNRAGQGPGQRRGGPGMGAPGQGQGGPGRFLKSILTEAQQADLEAIRDARRADIETLMTQLREARAAQDQSAIDEAHEALRALHEEVKAEVEAYLAANLTQEQLEAIEAARAEHEAEREARQAAEREVMAEVLGVGSEEVANILTAVDAFREAVQAIDRSGDVAAQFSAALTDLNAAVAAILTDDAAFEIFQIHQAIAARAHGQRPGGPGGRRPQGGGSQG